MFNNPEWITILGIVLIGIGTYFVYYGRKINNSIMKGKLDNQTTQISSQTNILNEQTKRIESQEFTIRSLETNNVKLSEQITKLGDKNLDLISQNTELLGSNKSIQTNNQDLYEQNKGLTGKIENYQQELEEKTKKIQELEDAENNRTQSEKELEALKKTSPNVEFGLNFKGNDLVIEVKFNNRVPIILHPKLHSYGPWECDDHSKSYSIFRTAQHDLNPPTIYPPKKLEDKVEVVYDSIKKEDNLPFDKNLCMRMNVTYSSIYADEVKIERLKNIKMKVDYAIEANTKRFIKTQFKEE